MWRPLIVALIMVVALAGGNPARAQTDGWLLAPFDGTRLSWSDRRFLQMALAMTGDYVGMLDGAWGRQSQEALEAHARREYDAGYVSALEVGGLVLAVIGEIDESGWKYTYFETVDLSLLTPDRRMSAPRTSGSGRFVDFNLLGGTLAYSLTIGDGPFTARLHEFTLGEVAGRSAPYTVRKPKLLITSGETASGRLFYTRSDWRAGGWSTVMLSASGGDRPLVHMVAGSVRRGRTPPMAVEPDGELVRIVRATVAALEESERRGDVPLPDVRPPDPGASSRAAPDTGSRTAISSGSGFVVGPFGEVLSNAHVVSGCRAITVDGQPANVRATNDDFDLALIDTGVRRHEIAAFAAGPAALNSDVTVIGYPLSGVLGGVNVTRGAVSSLSGMGGDATRMQISAPVQPGNSGGPVIDQRGAVVGVVVSKLDAQRMAETMGDIPQNVNFAIRGEIAKLFLSMNGVEPSIESATDPLAPEDLARRMTKVTVFVECR
ncbi:trypsin-like peptidase domain-containing protein [Albidovulum sp.]|uniref:trypsin-like peptidase domain-containing protein n=1 Tax=Albidovulum sp. TaxID=1872424 RepID=UPI0039B94D56